MIHSDGYCERAFWDPAKNEEVTMKVPNTTAGYAPQSGKMAAENRLDEIRKEKRGLVVEAQERYFRSLPSELRKLIVTRIADYELNFPPESLFTTDKLSALAEEEQNLINMIYGGRNYQNDDERAYVPHPYPALEGLNFNRLIELDLEATIDKAVT